MNWFYLIDRILFRSMALDDAFWSTLSRDWSKTVLSKRQRWLSHTWPNITVSIWNSLTLVWVAIWVILILLLLIIVAILDSLWSGNTPSCDKTDWVCFAQIEILSFHLAINHVLSLLSLKKRNWFHSVTVNHCFLLFLLEFDYHLILRSIFLNLISGTFLWRKINYLLCCLRRRFAESAAEALMHLM